MANMIKKKYVPDIKNHHAKQEQNFLRLIKLLPNLDNTDEYSILLDSLNQLANFKVTQRDKYTLSLTFNIKHLTLNDHLHNFKLHVRMYFDLNMAEIVATEHGKQFSGSYPYPNEQMHQVNEKEQINELFEQWLICIVKFGIYSKKIIIN
ncbi:MAG: DUF1249 domain-containing protein [Saccharospirillaceae bacterium]|nr:DUF1249 domain-containing protein [Pseudomonadales bacterium]NRB78270.1 DUF1249 domain-containing protein [Saccharospirillaceae bacterium]